MVRWTRVVVVSALLVGAAGCKKQDEPAASLPAPTGATGATGSAGAAAVAIDAAPLPDVSCEVAAKKHNELAAADPSTVLGAAKAKGEAEEGMVALMKYSFEEFCDQYWSAAIRACVGGARTGAESNRCFPSDMLAALDQMVNAEIVDMRKNKALNDAKAAGEPATVESGSAVP